MNPLRHLKLKFLISHILLFLAVPPLLFGQAQPTTQAPTKKEKTVGKITIIVHNLKKGTEANEAAIRKQLKTKIQEPFSQQTFDEDLKYLSKEYDKVDPSIDLHNNEVFITLNLWPKPTINAITWEGNDKVRTKKLNKELDVKVGESYDRDNFVKAFNQVKLYYVKEGYYESQLSYTVTPSDDNGVDITINVDEGNAGKIANIIYKGLDSDEEYEVNSMLMTKKYFFLTSWYDSKGILNKEMLEQDRITVLQYLQNQGYANATVTATVDERTNIKDRVDITFDCVRGPLFTTGRVTFSGNTLFDSEQIDKLFAIRKGMPFSPEKIRQTVRNITTLYGSKGYIDAAVTYEPQLVQGENVYNINFRIFEGKQFRVGMIKLFGNTSTQTDVILHESVIVPGEIFDSRKLERTEQRLKNIGYFENVNVYAVQSQDDSLLGPTFRDVHIEVVETNTGNLSFFFGFSTLTNVFGGIELTERNFNYKGLARIFKDGPAAIRGGGEALRLRFNVGRKEYMYFLSWTKPYFLDTKWSVGFDLEKTSNRLVSSDYDIDSFGFSLHAGYPLNNYVRFGTQYRFRSSNVKISADSDISQEEKGEANNDGIVSAVGASLTYSSVNHPFEPTKGFRSRLGAEFAGLGGNYTFFTTDYINTYYYPLTSRNILKYRADLRFLFPVGSTTYEKLPLDERYFLGGENSVRGYRSYRIGPKFEGGDPRGGISSMLLSMEYTYKMFERFDAFAFMDGGSLSSEEFRIDRFRYSWGFGGRLKIIGNIPVTVGMGFPVNAQSDADIRRFFISLGGNF